MHAWDSGQYLRFADERTRPALDLLARLDQAAPRHRLLLYPRLFFIATPR